MAWKSPFFLQQPEDPKFLGEAIFLEMERIKSQKKMMCLLIVFIISQIFEAKGLLGWGDLGGNYSSSTFNQPSEMAWLSRTTGFHTPMTHLLLS